MIGKKISRTELFLDRANRHGLYYLIKAIEHSAPPTMVINSFWRSGSTFLLELVANAFKMRPYFEPITPIEPCLKFIYEDYNLPYNLDRLNPVLSISDQSKFKDVMDASRFKSKWVYQNANFSNFYAKNGKVMKLVTGAHLLDSFSQKETQVYHLERNIYEVVESFINSSWTKKFLKNVDLNIYRQSEDKRVADFYSAFTPFLKLNEFSFHQAVAIYKTLSDTFVKKHYTDVRLINYNDLKTNPLEVIKCISDQIKVKPRENKLKEIIEKPSRMTVYNNEKLSLSVTEKQEINTIIAHLNDRINQL